MDFAVEQNSGVRLNAQKIGSGTGGNLDYEKFKQFILNFLINLQCVIFIFVVWHNC